MKKGEIFRNLATATIPICVVVFIFVWLIYRNVIGASILPILIFAASLYGNVGKYYDDIKRDAAGVTKKKFKASKAYELAAPDDSVGPSLCLEIENNKYLLTNGQWIYSEKAYGDEAANYYDEESDIFNCYNPPYSFPSTEFEIWVSNLDGKLSRIVVLGDYLEPEQVNWPTPEKYYKNDHVIIDRAEVVKDENV